jgi:hypothetical protein
MNMKPTFGGFEAHACGGPTWDARRCGLGAGN